MEGLTPRQQQVLRLIKAHWRTHQVFPSLRELAEALGVGNKSGVVNHIKALERKGFICKKQYNGYYALADQQGSIQSSSLEVDSQENSFSLMAKVPAGSPLTNFEPPNELMTFNPDYFGGGKLIAIYISGNSMSGDSISHGDIGIIKEQQEAGDNDIVVVRLHGDEVTLKRLRYDEGWVDLIPSNPEFKAIRLPAKDVEIIGRLVGIVRKTLAAKVNPYGV